MTSVDSGIETSNSSDDNSITPNEDALTEKIYNARSAIATINSNQNDIREIKPATFCIRFGSGWPVGWPVVCLPLSSLGSVNSDIQNSIPTSTGPVLLPSNALELPGRYNSVSTGKADRHSYCRKMVSVSASRASLESIPAYDLYSTRIERRMRIAAATNNIMMMTRLLDCGGSPNTCDLQGRTPLHLASCRGYTEMVNLLLERGADPNLRDSVGNTPLHLAAVTCKISVVTLLLNAGTDPLCLDQYGYNPLHLAQTKLKLLQNCKGEELIKIKEEVQNIVYMLLAYLQKHKDAHKKKVETLSNFCSRLSLSNTSDQVQDDVKDLLANLDALSITH